LTLVAESAVATAASPRRVRADPPEAAWIDHPSGFLALSSRNSRFTRPGRPGFIAYRPWGGHLIAFGGVHAPPEERADLLAAFLAEAERQRRHALFVQVSEDMVPLLRTHGMTVNQLGTSFVLDLVGYGFGGSQKMQLRNKISRANRAGIRVLEFGADVPVDAASFESLRAITAAWLARKRKPELDFMIGEPGEPGDPCRRIFIALDAAGRHVGFITYVPVWGRLPGYLHDLTRKLPDAPTGTMEAINAHVIGKFMAEQVHFLHLGFTPFILSGEEYPGASRAMAWLARMLLRYGKAVYPAASQAAYKTKWGTQIRLREFIAGKPLSLRATFDLLRLTRSL
jgi:lysylphosphatidylglycerol synthetase-like protein (DUF2156 family)